MPISFKRTRFGRNRKYKNKQATASNNNIEFVYRNFFTNNLVDGRNKRMKKSQTEMIYRECKLDLRKWFASRTIKRSVFGIESLAANIQFNQQKIMYLIFIYPYVIHTMYVYMHCIYNIYQVSIRKHDSLQNFSF